MQSQVLSALQGRTVLREGGFRCNFLSPFGRPPRSTLRYFTVMPIDDLQLAAQKIAGFLNTLNKLGGLRLKYRITAGDGARDPQGIEARQIYIELAGPDVPLVVQHNG